MDTTIKIFLLSSILVGFIMLISSFIISSFREQKTYEIRTCQDLQDMNLDLNGNYILMNDIDCKGF